MEFVSVLIMSELELPALREALVIEAGFPLASAARAGKRKRKKKSLDIPSSVPPTDSTTPSNALGLACCVCDSSEGESTIYSCGLCHQSMHESCALDAIEALNRSDVVVSLCICAKTRFIAKNPSTVIDLEIEPDTSNKDIEELALILSGKSTLTVTEQVTQKHLPSHSYNVSCVCGSRVDILSIAGSASEEGRGRGLATKHFNVSCSLDCSCQLLTLRLTYCK